MASTTTSVAGYRRLSFADNASLKSSLYSDRPPSYSRHQNDELLSSAAVGRSRRRNTVPRASARRADPAIMLQILRAPGPLELALDNGLIYPPPPSNALYHLPRVLTWSGNEIFLFRSLPSTQPNRSAAMPPRDLALYTIRRTPLTNDIALVPRREGLMSAFMRGRKSLLSGMSWRVEVRGGLNLRYSSQNWKDANGVVVAEEVHEPGQPHVLRIIGPDLEVNAKDLIVAVWLARMWHAKSRHRMTAGLRWSEQLRGAHSESLYGFRFR